MANVAQGTVWNLPNYVGELYTASPTETPILTMIGAMTNGGVMTDNFQFPCGQTYDHEAASQPAITETASLTAPTAISYVRGETTNVTQIFQETVSVTYERLANQGRMSGINTAGQENPVADEKDFQIALALEKIARDMEYSLINGAYNLSAAVNQANKTRGLIAAASTTANAAAAPLSKAMLDAILLAAYNAGAMFKNAVIWCGGLQKQRISGIYGYAPQDRMVGGVNVEQIETDFGTLGIKLNKFMPAGTILIAEMSVLRPVYQPVPKKGNFFYEALSKTGAAESGMIFGKFGLDHGPGFAHATITNLAVV